MATAAIFAWRNDAVELLRDARESVVAEWHQYGTREQAVDDLAAYLLAAWTQSGETTASLLLMYPPHEEDDDDSVFRAALAAAGATDPRAGQLRLARLVAESAVAEVLADVPARSYDDVAASAEPDLDADSEARIDAALAWIDAANADLAGQRTAAWHRARAQLFSASTIHKLVSTPAQFNALIYEKCLAMRRRALQGERQEDAAPDAAADDAGPRPLRYKPRAPGAMPMRLLLPEGGGTWTPPVFRRVLDARNWGTKMEPLSAAFYCFRNRSAAGVEPELRTDLGCLAHRTYAFLGASPDGVVVGPRGHPRRGCNVEIKNIVDRPITGDPKPEHYAQFQLQMEVCDLPRTDFLETRFCEYEFPQDYFMRQQLRPDLPHGLVLHFAPSSGGGGGGCAWDNSEEEEEEGSSSSITAARKAEWVYSRPGQQLRTCEEVDAWIAAESAARCGRLKLDETTYWVLEEYSCVRSDRNREWFAAVLPTLAEAWRTVERESQSGFEHRAPSRRGGSAATAAVFGDDEEEGGEEATAAGYEPAAVMAEEEGAAAAVVHEEEEEDIVLLFPRQELPPPPPPPPERNKRRRRKREAAAFTDDEMLLAMMDDE